MIDHVCEVKDYFWATNGSDWIILFFCWLILTLFQNINEILFALLLICCRLFTIYYANKFIYYSIRVSVHNYYYFSALVFVFDTQIEILKIKLNELLENNLCFLSHSFFTSTNALTHAHMLCICLPGKSLTCVCIDKLTFVIIYCTCYHMLITPETNSQSWEWKR
jgi:hypothetical protein